jgi:NADPH2:quinone reductase
LINPIGAEYPLAEAAKAHTDLEAGRTTGSVILTVG